MTLIQSRVPLYMHYKYLVSTTNLSCFLCYTQKLAFVVHYQEILRVFLDYVSKD
jgi:hypothetical protein